MTPPETVLLPFPSDTHRPSPFGVNLCSAVVLLSVSVRLPLPSTTITLPLFALSYLSTWPFRSSVTVRLTVREVLMLMSVVSLTVSKLTSAIALVSSSSVLTSFAVSLPPINDVKAASGWGSDTSPSGCTAASSAGWAHFAQFSGKAPSAPQTGQSVFMLSAVQAVSQLQTGGVSVLSSAKAAVGIRHSSIHKASRVLNMRFFILLPPFRRLLTA